MGAINYGTSDYISIGLNVSGDFDEWEQEERRNEIDAILENYGFWYFHVTLKSGYYEGSILILKTISLAFSIIGRKSGTRKRKLHRFAAF